MDIKSYQRKRAKVEEACRHHFITPKCEQSLLKILALQMHREGEAQIKALRDREIFLATATSWLTQGEGL